MYCVERNGVSKKLNPEKLIWMMELKYQGMIDVKTCKLLNYVHYRKPAGNELVLMI